jgi:putative flippase GtrA
MNAPVRWLRFNLVGAIGMAVQLGALALLNRWTGGRYLLASGLAVELALLHNFLWHWRYTWPDRVEGAGWLRILVRFQLSNGLVSLLGNLVVMRALVHAPLLVGNLVAIVVCSLANFWLGDGWVFRAGGRYTPPPGFGSKYVV